MLQLPTEILQAIYPLACVDGGRTGCSLSQVCKRIRETSFPSRFHSVALPTPDMLDAFCALLGGPLVGRDVIVRHLFIGYTAPGPSERDQMEWEYTQYFMSANMNDPSPPGVRALRRTWNAYYSHVIHTLKAFSRTLLSVHIGYPGMGCSLRAEDLPISFPVLNDLWLCLPLERGLRFAWSPAQVFPALRQMRLEPFAMAVYIPNQEGSCRAFDALLATLPTLTHLYISARPDDHTLQSALVALLGASSTLKRVSIELPPVSQSSASLMYILSITEDNFRRLADSDGRVVVPEVVSVDMPSLIRGWLSRVW